ncbi:uncharacterized protein LOC133307428 [Gastrolobium bilobum]|uniref:uncharacterized protein LOC133307428 n=1 Tax=Gastrolobium bilobum TaxID=150636 RepID=UPI002AB1DE0F|nr:uncharacterized protein LOC133307428 [Gastrolobium bilobum]
MFSIINESGPYTLKYKGAYKYVSELSRKKQSDVMRFLQRVRCWEYRQQPSIVHLTRPTRPHKARRLGYKAKQNGPPCLDYERDEIFKGLCCSLALVTTNFALGWTVYRVSLWSRHWIRHLGPGIDSFYRKNSFWYHIYSCDIWGFPLTM